MIEIRNLSGGEGRARVEALSEVLLDCVEGGERILLAAFLDGELVGTVQLIVATPPNQPHRADVAKLLVSRKARGQGIAALLMRHVEEVGRNAGKTLLVLDTVAGGDAERLYERLGWSKVGVIPGYALFPDGRPCDTTVFYKRLP